MSKEAELKIIVETIFIHPNLGGKPRIDISEYEMKDALMAESEYNKQNEQAQRSGGCYRASIYIVHKSN